TFSGVDGLCATNVDLDLLGLGFGTLGQLELQHPSVVIGGDAFAIDRRGQGERPDKAAIAALDTAEVLFFLFLFELALAAHGQNIVFDLDVEVFLFDPRHFQLELDAVFVFVNVNRRHKGSSGQ